jgi:hypothetical protein
MGQAGFIPRRTTTYRYKRRFIGLSGCRYRPACQALRCSKPERENLRQEAIIFGVISTGQSTPYACTIKSYLKSGATSCSSFSLETYGKLTDCFFFFLFFNRMVNDPSNEFIRWSDAAFFGAHHLPLNLTMNRLSTIPITVSASHTKFSADGSNIVTSAPLYANSTCMGFQSSPQKATMERNFGILLMPIVIMDSLVCFF